MAFRKIDTRIWNDEKFRSLTDDGKLAFLFILTHPNMTPLGAMRATMAGLASELGWDVEAFREAFGEALSKGMVEADEKACFVGAPNFIRYNQPESPNVITSWVRGWELIPECGARVLLLQRLKAFTEGLSEGFREAFGKAFGKTMPNQEQEQEQEQEHNTPLPPQAGESVFSRFWKEWPEHHNKVNRERCEKHWKNKHLDAEVVAIIDGLKAWKRSVEWERDNKKRIPIPYKWLRQRRWEAMQPRAPSEKQKQVADALAKFSDADLLGKLPQFIDAFPMMTDAAKERLRANPRAHKEFTEWVLNRKENTCTTATNPSA